MSAENLSLIALELFDFRALMTARVPGEKGAVVDVDQEVRKLRSKVYGECTDGNWLAVKHNWVNLDSIRWLKKKAAEPLKFS